MLISLIKRLFFHKSPRLDQNVRRESFEEANSFNLAGDARTAITKFRAHLERFPLDVEAINNLGCCLVDIGDHSAAGQLFEQAFSIDDSYLPVVINHAKHLIDNNRIRDGLEFLKQAKAYEPDSQHVSAVYAGAAIRKGDAETAARYARIAWLSSFDNLRLANCYLFYCSYTNMDETALAAEHRFWAETLFHRSFPFKLNDCEPALPPSKEGKIRIAYWSPDFRNHSVRFFARPLLENHDKNKFEVVVYHDAPYHDDQTEAIKAVTDHFFSVSEIPDEKLVNLIKSHKIDILIELAGHSSANRLNLLHERLATKQITALGYPPTTGLSTIDAKFLDRHIADASTSHFYTEMPLVLDGSFWCFDPSEQPEISPAPPSVENGFITFACVGNISKITQQILNCWAEILVRVQNSQLLIRSISLEDPAAARFIADRLESSGIEMTRVKLLGPAAGSDFFKSYNEVDIVLDTFPFNGGTTTCFATYMGVPVLSLSGKSLVSRMGKSILSNIDLKDWIATDYSDYIEKAVTHAQNRNFLKLFRTQARNLYATSALGNGKIFTKDVEAQYIALLEKEGTLPRHNVKALSAKELVKRAHAVLRHGQFEPARRIVDHCLAEYPDCGAAHVLWTHRLTEKGQFGEAAEYLESRLEKFQGSDRLVALINIARFSILAGLPEKVTKTICAAKLETPFTKSNRLQLKLLEAYLETTSNQHHNRIVAPLETSLSIRNITVLIVCDDRERFLTIKDGFQHTCKQIAGLIVNYIQCPESSSWHLYQSELARVDDGAIFIVHKNVTVRNEWIFHDVISALDRFDIIGIGGAKKWDRIDWRLSPFEEKVGSFLIPSGESENFHEVNFIGEPLDTLVGGLCVLDGSFLAVRKARLHAIETSKLFDPILNGAGILQEEFFTHEAYLAGLKLAAHLNLGVVIDWRIPLANNNLPESRWQIAQRMSFDPFLEQEEDRTVTSIPVNSAETGIATIANFLGH